MLSFRLLLATLASRRVQIVGATPHPGEPFMQQVVRTLTAAEDGLLVQHRVLIGDRDTKWSAPAGERHLRRTIVQYVEHDHRERNHYDRAA